MACPGPPEWWNRLLQGSENVEWNKQKWLYDLWEHVCRDRLIPFTIYDAEPARAAESNVHGGLLSLATGQPLTSAPVNIVVTKGIGKVLIVVNDATPGTGTITLTGTTVDRETGATTGADTDDMPVDTQTTDGSTTDANGNTVHSFSNAYISSKWFEGTVTASTADLTLANVDVYHVSFEQCNDTERFVIETLDMNVFTASTSAEIDVYLYTLQVVGSKCTISNLADMHIGLGGRTALANRYERLRRGNLDFEMFGAKDGFWVDAHYSNSPSWVEDVTLKVWVTQ